MRLLTPILLILLAAAPALAQPWQGAGCDNDGPGFWAKHQGGFGGGPGRMGDGPGRRGDGPPRKMVESFRLYKLTEFLELNEAQTEKIYPRMAAINKLHEEHREQMQDTIKELRSLLDDEKTKEAAKLAATIHDERGAFQARMHEAQGEIIELLDDEQKAKYVLFEKRFERHLRQVAERLHGRMGERAPRGEGHGPGGGPGRGW